MGPTSNIRTARIARKDRKAGGLQTNKQTTKQTNKQTTKQSNKQINKQTNKQSNRQTNKQSNTQAERKKERHEQTNLLSCFLAREEASNRCVSPLPLELKSNPSTSPTHPGFLL